MLIAPAADNARDTGLTSGPVRSLTSAMALPSAYLITTKNLDSLLAAMRDAKAPPKFTQRFLEGLDFKSTNDRLYINVFKALGFLADDGTPTERYYEFLDQRQSGRVLAESVEEAYADLFQIRRDAQNMERAELKGKIKTLTQGQYSENVVDKMALTFKALADASDWSAPKTPPPPKEAPHAGDAESGDSKPTTDLAPELARPPVGPGDGIKLGGFVYNIELHLPDSRDPAVYEALFKALKAHLLS